MSWASGKIELAPDNLSLRKAQKLTPSFRHVFFRLAKVSRQRRPRSLRVETADEALFHVFPYVRLAGIVVQGYVGPLQYQ